MHASQHPAKRFSIVLIKPSHYDDDGYVIQWLRSAIPSNTLAVMNGLALDCQRRRVLGDGVEIAISSMDETNTRVQTARLVRQLAGAPSLVCLIGVQSNQYPRAMDIARPLREAGIPVCLGGFHVSGVLAMLPEPAPELTEAMDLGISLFAGEAEGRFEEVVRDAYSGALKPLYNYLEDLPALDGVPLPILPATRIKRTSGNLTSFDAGRGCPFQCSFCTIINVQGRKSRWRTADEVEQIIRLNLAQGINRFFITDDNFARNHDWESIFDRLIEMREKERANIKFVIQVDTMCHKLKGFVEKAGRAGVTRVFIGMESINPEALLATRKPQNQITEYRRMLLAWKSVGAIVFAGYILGFPNDTPESIARDIKVIQRELPVDLLEFHYLTPLPGSEDHKKLFMANVEMERDLNKYDMEHVTTAHRTMTAKDWERAYQGAWELYYSPEHMETLMRRAAATRINAGNMLFLLVWFYNCFALEGVDPLQGGYLRRKYRMDRRHTLPVESPLVFYPRYAREFAVKHVKLAKMVWRGLLFRYGLKRNPESRNYTDVALTPAQSSDLESLELFKITDSAKTAASKAINAASLKTTSAASRR